MVRFEAVKIVKKQIRMKYGNQSTESKKNRRQIVDFIADNGISDSKSISKAIGLKPSRTRDYLKQLVDEGILEWRGSIKTGSIGLRSKCLTWMGM